MSKSRVWLAVIVVTIVAVLVAVVSLTRQSVPAGAAFVYGDRVVTTAELNKRIDLLRALYGITAPKSGKDRDRFRRSAAKSYAVTLILDRKAQELGVRVSEKKARDLLDRFIDTQFGNRDTFVEVLGNVGTSERAVLNELRRQGTTIELRTKVIGKITISDAFLKSSFERRKAELATPERRRLNNIVVPTRDEAQRVAEQLAAGEPVEAVAAAASIDEATRNNGGDLGYLVAAQLEDPVAKAAFGAEKGQVYGPAKGSHGWNVGVVAAVAAPQPAKYAEVKGAFREQLRQEQAVRTWSDWLAKVIREADIRYADDYRPADPDAPPPLTPATQPPTTQPPAGGAIR
ncbi:MAG TPA: peptidyl-prolyl cis-trans isomerase [Aeromicrobium sp.]|nr:peptidyl-prolyl cis-trans isomerase [Aeromicrobium sp.]HKY58571.1 peptidyl-prolyl cis-trans isomerase [Aeromicrobium sp.]